MLIGQKPRLAHVWFKLFGTDTCETVQYTSKQKKHYKETDGQKQN